MLDFASFECLFNESLLYLLMLDFATEIVVTATSISSVSARILVCYIDLLLSCVFLQWPPLVI